MRSKFPNKWTEERDDRCREWLKPTRIPWEPAQPPSEPPTPPQSELEKLIRAFNDYGVYINANVDIAALTLSEALALQEQLTKWGCNVKKAKGDKPKHWQALQKRLKEVRK